MYYIDLSLIFTVLIEYLLLFPAIISTCLWSFSSIHGPRDKGIIGETLNDHGCIYGRESPRDCISIEYSKLLIY